MRIQLRRADRVLAREMIHGTKAVSFLYASFVLVVATQGGK